MTPRRSLPLVLVCAVVAGCNAVRVEPHLNPAMQRALSAYAPGFRRFSADEYARGVDTSARADGDFNGDGLPDLALYGHDSSRELLFVLLSGPRSVYRVVPLREQALAPFQNGAYTYLKTHPPGPLELPEEFKKLLDPQPPERLAHAAIDVGIGNEAGELYYWDGQQFVKVVTGD
jgi:hypothetical protein